MIFTSAIVILSFISVITPWVVAQKYGVVKFVSPLHIVCYFAFFGTLTKTIYSLLTNDGMYIDGYNLSNSEILVGYSYVALYVAMLTLGYLPKKNRRKMTMYLKPKVVSVFAINSSVLAAVSIGIIVILISFILKSSGFRGFFDIFSLSTLDVLNSTKIKAIEGVEGYGSSFAALALLVIVPKIALVCFLIRYLVNKQKSARNFFIAILLLLVLLTLSQGKRFGLVNLALIVTSVYMLLNLKINTRFILKAGVASLLILSIFVLMTNLRLNKGETSTVEFGTELATRQIFASTYFLDVNVPTLVIAHFGTFEPMYGGSYINWTWGFIPRAVWPNKPAVTIGSFVKQDVLKQYGTIGGINPTGPGEAFINFGWFGLLVAYLIGALYRKLEELTLTSTGFIGKHGLVFYPLSVIPFVQITLQSSFSAAIVSLTAQLVVAYFYIKSARINRRH